MCKIKYQISDGKSSGKQEWGRGKSDINQILEGRSRLRRNSGSGSWERGKSCLLGVLPATTYQHRACPGAIGAICSKGMHVFDGVRIGGACRIVIGYVCGSTASFQRCLSVVGMGTDVSIVALFGLTIQRDGATALTPN